MIKNRFIFALKFLLKVALVFFIFTVAWVILYAFVNPPISGMMVYKKLTEEQYDYVQTWVDLDQIDPSIPLAFMAAEDQLFFEHNGLDFKAIVEARKHNKNSKHLRGASTISQQLAKNLFLIPSKTYLRKALEVYFTTLMELFWSKCRIMELYLNMVELGPGVYGVEEAAVRYFKLPAAKVGIEQASLMATALPNPIKFQLSAPSIYMRKRQKWVKRQMRNLGGTAVFTTACGE